MLCRSGDSEKIATVELQHECHSAWECLRQRCSCETSSGIDRQGYILTVNVALMRSSDYASAIVHIGWPTHNVSTQIVQPVHCCLTGRSDTFTNAP